MSGTHLILTATYEFATVIIIISMLTWLRKKDTGLCELFKFMCLVKWQNQDLNPLNLLPKSMLLNSTLNYLIMAW